MSEIARARGLATDVGALRHGPPAYLLDRAAGQHPTVPCYVGYFFSIVLGSGDVVGCCQTQASLGNVADGGFRAVWRGPAYRQFRRAGRGLPAAHPALATCECDSCFFRPHNVAIHNLVRWWSRIPPAQGEATMRLGDWLRLSRLEG